MTSDIEKAFGAVRSGDVGLLEGLHASDPSLAASRGENGVSLILTACYFRRAEMVDFLVARVGSLDIFESSAIERATDARVVAFLDEDASLTGAFSADGFTPLHLASYFRPRRLRASCSSGGPIRTRSRAIPCHCSRCTAPR